MEGHRAADGPQAARQVGRARRRHRYRDGQAPAATARHLRVPALGAGRRSVGLRSRASGNAGHGVVVGPPLRGVAIGRDVEGAGAVRVGDPPHRGRARRDPPRPARPGGRGGLARRLGRGRRPVMAVDPDLPHRPARCPRRRGGGRPVAAEPRRPSADAACCRQAAEGEGGRRLDRGAGGPVPDGQRRPPLGRRVPPRRALRPASLRGAGAQVGRPRPGRRHTAH